MIQVVLLLLPVSMEALYANQEVDSQFQLTKEDQQILENLQSLRADMGMPPLVHYNFAFQEGSRCQSRYLSANKGAVECSGKDSQILSRRGYHDSCKTFIERWQKSYSATHWFRFYHTKDSINEFFDCESDTLTDAVEQILGSPYKRIHLLNPMSIDIGWASDRYKKLSDVHGITSRRVSGKFYFDMFGEAPKKPD